MLNCIEFQHQFNSFFLDHHLSPLIEELIGQIAAIPVCFQVTLLWHFIMLPCSFATLYAHISWVTTPFNPFHLVKSAGGSVLPSWHVDHMKDATS